MKVTSKLMKVTWKLSEMNFQFLLLWISEVLDISDLNRASGCCLLLLGITISKRKIINSFLRKKYQIANQKVNQIKEKINSFKNNVKKFTDSTLIILDLEELKELYNQFSKHLNCQKAILNV